MRLYFVVRKGKGGWECGEEVGSEARRTEKVIANVGHWETWRPHDTCTIILPACSLIIIHACTRIKVACIMIIVQALVL